MDPVKPQKSRLWIWTTLWLTTILDSALIFLVLLVILAVIVHITKAPVILLVSAFAARFLALWLGAYVAVKYVLKKTVVFKKDAHKFALLTVIIPLSGSVMGVIFSAFDLQNLAGNVLNTILVLGVTYYSVKNLIMKYGNE